MLIVYCEINFTDTFVQLQNQGMPPYYTLMGTLHAAMGLAHMAGEKTYKQMLLKYIICVPVVK